MSKTEKQIIYNVDRFIISDSLSQKEKEDKMAESRERVALAIGRQLLKRGLIKFDAEHVPGPNAGERRIIVKGDIAVCKTEQE